MGDAYGPLFGTCDSWSFSEDRKCTGKMTKKGIFAVRVIVGIAICLITIAGIITCVRAFNDTNKESKNEDHEYMAIPEQ